LHARETQDQTTVGARIENASTNKGGAVEMWRKSPNNPAGSAVADGICRQVVLIDGTRSTVEDQVVSMLRLAANDIRGSFAVEDSS